MEAEATMICVDNSRWLIASLFEEQADAIKLYCTEKLNANPKNVVGIASTANYILHVAVAPTKDISTIMNTVFGLAKGGRLDLPTAIASSQIVWCNGLNKDLKKRIVVFAGGEAYNHTAADAEHLGLCLKKYDIACDAVNFGDQSSEKRQFLETLVAAAENSRNSRILHVEPHMSVGQALASSQIIPTRVGESSSPPPDIKDKEYYSKIPHVDDFDLLMKSFDNMFEHSDLINSTHKAAAIAQAAEYSSYLGSC